MQTPKPGIINTSSGFILLSYVLASSLLCTTTLAAEWSLPQLNMSDPKCDGSLVEVASIDNFRKAVGELNRGILKAGTVIRLTANRYSLPSDAPPIKFHQVQGSEECPIVVEGEASGSLLDGERKPMVNYAAPRIGFPEESWVNCFVLRDSSWIIFRNLHVRNCWPTFLFIDASSYITLQNTRVTGSTYAVFMQDLTHHVLIENNIWEQDPSGEVWSTIPWGIVHHGSRAYLNGAFVGATTIPGGVIVRHNTIANAYNAIRLKSVDCPPSKLCNANVEIYDNNMAYIRDNPIEIEQHAANWWIHGNRILNSHAWFSMDGGKGGPHFVFGNVGWFDDVPGNLCKNESWDGETEADGTPFRERECERSRGGKVLKLGNQMELPVYVFHNSWYLRTPAVSGGTSGPLRFWNNAIEFCPPRADDDICTPVTPFYKDEDEDRFLWDVDIKDGAQHRFAYVLSNAEGFPDQFRAQGYPVHGFFAIKVGFIHPSAGDFRLGEDSPAKSRGCHIHRAESQKLTCEPVAPELRPDIGAYQTEQPYQGPPFAHLDGPRGPDSEYVEPPRIIRLSSDALDQNLFTIHFSVDIEISDASLETEAVLETAEGSRVTVPCIVVLEDQSVLVCNTADAVAPFSTVSRVLLPDHIRRKDGAHTKLTFWGNPEPIIGSQ